MDGHEMKRPPLILLHFQKKDSGKIQRNIFVTSEFSVMVSKKEKISAAALCRCSSAEEHQCHREWLPVVEADTADDPVFFDVPAVFAFFVKKEPVTHPVPSPHTNPHTPRRREIVNVAPSVSIP
jgi:hypothetical protein